MSSTISNSTCSQSLSNSEWRDEEQLNDYGQSSFFNDDSTLQTSPHAKTKPSRALNYIADASDWGQHPMEMDPTDNSSNRSLSLEDLRSDCGIATSWEEDTSTDEEIQNEYENSNCIPDCEPIGRDGWDGKCLKAMNKDGTLFGLVFVCTTDPNACVDGHRAIGEDNFGIVPIEIHVGDHGLRDEVLSWSTRDLFFGDVSVYDHGRRYDEVRRQEYLKKQRQHGKRPYNSSRIKHPQPLPKKAKVMQEDSILKVYEMNCCNRRCTRLFSPSVILRLRTNMYSQKFENFYGRNIDIHGMIHNGNNGKEKLVTIENEDICIKGWRIIHNVSSRSFNRYKARHQRGEYCRPHGNKGKVKTRASTIQATETLKGLLDGAADQPTHLFHTRKDGERVPQYLLPTGTTWLQYLPEINAVNRTCHLKPISTSCLSKIRKTHFDAYSIKRRGDNFSRCSKCDTLQKLKAKAPPASRVRELYNDHLQRHLRLQRTARLNYYGKREKSIRMPSKSLCIIHDKMDHSKTASPCFANRTKDLDSFMKLPVSVTGMIAHGHGDVRFAHYNIPLFPCDSNFTIGSIAKLLRDLEDVPSTSSRTLFPSSGSHPIYRALLRGSEICVASLRNPGTIPREARPLPPVLHIQLDNSWKDNKNRYMFCFWSLLVGKRIVNEVVVSYMLVGHTHDDIDGSFGRWSKELKTTDYPTIPLLMKSYMDLDKDCEAVIPHLVEEVPDFKKFIAPYLPKQQSKTLVGHSKGCQFRFYRHEDGWPLMQYRVSYKKKEWLPRNSPGIKLWREDTNGMPMLPLSGEPNAVPPKRMQNVTEIIRGISGYISHWNSILEKSPTATYRTEISNYVAYWMGVKDALSASVDEDPPYTMDLQSGFWPRTRQAMHERTDIEPNVDTNESDDEEHYIGPAGDRPARFTIERDVRKGYLLFVRPAVGSEAPVWMARAEEDPQCDPNLPHHQEILVRWYVPAKYKYTTEAERYEGWNVRHTFSWKKDPIFNDPQHINTNSIMASWEPTGRTERTYFTVPTEQVEFAMDNLRRIAEAE